MAKLTIEEQDRLFDQKLIESMKEQMQPSDEVVSSLLTKIAKMEASSKIEEVRVEPVKTKTVKPVKNRAWFYATCVAASFVILVSTFAAFGGDSIDKVKAVFNKTLEGSTVVLDENNREDNSTVEKLDSNNKEEVVIAVTDTDQNVVTENTDTNSDTQQTDTKVNSKKDKNKNKNKNKSNAESVGTEQTVAATENAESENSESQNIDDENLDSQGEQSAESQNQENLTSEDNTENSSDENSGEEQSTNDSEGDETPVTPPLTTTVVTPPLTTTLDEGEGEGEGETDSTEENIKLEPVEMVTIDGNNYIIGSSSKTAVLSAESSVSLEVQVTPKMTMMVMALRSVSPTLMMAMASPLNEEEVILYTNADYVPENLGALVSDADIASITDYGFNGNEGLCIYTRKNIGTTTTQRYKADDLNTSVSTYLLSNPEAKVLSNSYYSSASTKVEFESTTNSTGLTLYFGVTNTGYLNIRLENEENTILNEFTFEIGRDQAKGFITDVTGK